MLKIFSLPLPPLPPPHGVRRLALSKKNKRARNDGLDEDRC